MQRWAHLLPFGRPNSSEQHQAHPSCSTNSNSNMTGRSTNEKDVNTSFAPDSISLPPPVLQANASVASRRSLRQSRTIAPLQSLKTRWERLKQLNSGPLPAVLGGSSETSSSAQRSPEESTQGGDEADHRDRHAMGSVIDDEDEEAGDAVTVDEVVVDRDWRDEIKASNAAQSLSDPPPPSTNKPLGNTGSHSPNTQAHRPDTYTARSSKAHLKTWNPINLIRYRAYPALVYFFHPAFKDKEAELQYSTENWYFKKPLARWTAVWFIFNWVLGCIFGKQPDQPFLLIDKIFYFCICPLFSLPVIVFVITDLVRDHPVWYQVYLMISVWMWPTYQVVFMYMCGFYSGHPIYFGCQGREFMGTLYYASATQTIALFGLNMKRLPSTIGAMSFVIISCVLIVPERLTWIRSMINISVFHGFLIYINYVFETVERRNFALGRRLKLENSLTRKAQFNERKSAESKRRLTSYVFHEVRVPLNTALLAVQNMSSWRDSLGDAACKEQDIEFTALEGSLSMMSKVLNDVLDFDRMDSGRFEQASSPYAFHHVMRSLLIPLRLATDARGLTLDIEFDPEIDKVARRAAYEAIGESAVAIERHMRGSPDVDGVVVGDETRLRQIVTNLASNGCKFTRTGGTLSVKTRLVLPRPQPEISIEPRSQEHLSGGHDPPHEGGFDDASGTTAAGPDRIVVRIEVTDTGYGIGPGDIKRGKLFSAFNQTERGRRQGGKGTGLGLALVRQIVSHSGGRLGVKSKKNEGSTFWVELPLGIGQKTLTKVAETLQDGSALGHGVLTGPAGVPGYTPPADVGGETDISVEPGGGESGGSPRRGALPLVHSFCSVGTEGSLPLADAAVCKAVQGAPVEMRSESALQGLMDQGGHVELRLSATDSSPVPTRTILDPSTGTEVDPLLHHNPFVPGSHPSTPNQSCTPTPADHTSPPPDAGSSSSDPSAHTRPTKIELPSPRAFTLDIDHLTPPTTVSTSSPQSSPGFSRISPGLPHTCANIREEAKLHVLVVDDDPLTRTLMTRFLHRLGCTVVTAPNGEAALELILEEGMRHGEDESIPAVVRQGAEGGEGEGSSGLHQTAPSPVLPGPNAAREDVQHPFDVVFLDNSMPVMSGLDAVARLRELGRCDFVVGVTGNALLNDQRQYLDAGVDHVVTKPVYEKTIKEILALAEERRKESTKT